MNENLKKSEEKYRLICENANDLIAILRIKYTPLFKIPDFLYEYINEAAHKRVLGYSSSDLINKPIQMIIDPRDLEDSIKTFLTVFYLEKGSAELHIKRKDGAFVWLDFQVMVLNEVNGTQKVILIGRDITEKKNLLTELQQKNKELEELSRLRNEFYSGLTHDIRSPLTVIKLSVELLLNSKNLDADQYETLRILQQNSDRLEHLTTELMEYTRLKQGQIHLNATSFRLSEIISQLKLELNPLIQEKGLQIIEQYNPDCELFLDKYQIIKVIRNLFENAIRYSFTKNQIIVTSSTHQNLWTCSIRDFGCGIAPANLENLFMPFTRFPEAKEMHRDGFGIGLMVCKKIIELYAGKIWAESAGLRKGSTFSFQIPLKF
ncbi:MAG TPA: PAS domain-containing sensor histidine kinase [Candidatus Deferrimicrobium sp.]|nr:PAS domain-containing sensor histidine kinase [Candidatus Deferrimicrobium sp.]